jgi:hypothetical protein
LCPKEKEPRDDAGLEGFWMGFRRHKDIHTSESLVRACNTLFFVGELRHGGLDAQRGRVKLNTR